jgi:phospholipase C
VIATLTERHGLAPLNERDAGAATLTNGITLAQPRDPATWPTTFPLFVPANPEAEDPIHEGQQEDSLAPPGIGLVSMLMAKYGEPGEPVPKTYLLAWTAVQKHGDGLFGT